MIRCSSSFKLKYMSNGLRPFVYSAWRTVVMDDVAMMSEGPSLFVFHRYGELSMWQYTDYLYYTFVIMTINLRISRQFPRTCHLFCWDYFPRSWYVRQTGAAQVFLQFTLRSRDVFAHAMYVRITFGRHCIVLFSGALRGRKFTQQTLQILSTEDA